MWVNHITGEQFSIAKCVIISLSYHENQFTKNRLHYKRHVKYIMSPKNATCETL